nr:MAG TPA: hypothetical protein [Bacteriophage sp.]
MYMHLCIYYRLLSHRIEKELYHKGIIVNNYTLN